jgi:ATP-dependent 26S proteasome regulatory subunit
VGLTDDPRKLSIPLTSTNDDDDPIHLDDLLNIIDGIKETPGRILIISSNHYDKLDDALTRPGRIDLTIKMDNASRKTIVEMYRHFYQADLADNIAMTVQDRTFSPAQIINQYILHKCDPEAFIREFTDTRKTP